MTKLNKRRLEVLEDTVKYYSEDPEGRRCMSRDLCTYSPEMAEKPLSDGCAVGRLLPRELSISLDKANPHGASVDGLINKLPKDIRDLSSKFLMDLQHLHDDTKFWDTKGITIYGTGYVDMLKSRITSKEYDHIEEE